MTFKKKQERISEKVKLLYMRKRKRKEKEGNQEGGIYANKKNSKKVLPSLDSASKKTKYKERKERRKEKYSLSECHKKMLLCKNSNRVLTHPPNQSDKSITSTLLGTTLFLCLSTGVGGSSLTPSLTSFLGHQLPSLLTTTALVCAMFMLVS